MSKTAPYGTWDSPISPDTITSKTITFDDVLVDPITKTIYHLEERPDDNGRCVIVDTTAKIDVLPSPYSARTFVQEYGGAPAIVYNNIIYFSNDTGDASNRDNKIYALHLTDGSLPKAITPDNYLLRYANFAIHPTQTNLLVTLREDHTNDPDYTAPENVVNTICVVDTNTATVNIVVQGADFYATPVFNPSGTKIGWQQWNLPDMPWQGDHILVAGEAGTKSATFPSWITDTTLAYITDGYNKYWNPYIFDTDTQQSRVVLKTSLEQDFAEPAWYLGLYPYAILDGGKYGAFTAFKDGGNILYIVDLSAPSDPVQIEFDYTVAQHVRAVTENTFVFTASKTAAPGGVILGTVLDSSGSYAVGFDTLKASADDDPDMDKYISPPIPKDLAIPSGHPIHVVYYAPYNPDYSGPSDPDEKPPVSLTCSSPAVASLGKQCCAIIPVNMPSEDMLYDRLDVNYRGSSGYGREYIDLLNSNWGIYDIQDCQQAAAAMATGSYIDGKRVAIRGGSAGAYTTLSSVTFAPDPTFYKTACGAYGCVTDVETLTKSTEKFESQYIYTLFGSPPDHGAWDARNPIKNVAKLSVSFLILQGLADGVVPPSIVRNFLSQSAEVAPSEEFAFYPNEGHHWHQASTIKDALLREVHLVPKEPVVAVWPFVCCECM
ncbi:Alpha/Beta hydrolase protein [Boletus reticuloceps]|uniref:Alpha/Beta hydrolase protein n=1 Tax=Boletus reticuloceps TaxID=495285 RepID=A0A8I2YKM8_9AGAM|nr:Alpha/Beta hydrolase protein [Boletus reticuloceps]